MTPKQIEAAYKTFIADTGGRCWRCGRTERDKPCWYFGAPFLIERAHIDYCNHPRENDRRAVWSACSLCHKIQHRMRFMYDLTDGGRFPLCTSIPLTMKELLKLKRDRDKDFFDPLFLAGHSIQWRLVESICRELEGRQ